MKTIGVRALSLFVGLLAATAVASAAEIAGTATDSSGGVLPFARVTVHNLATGADTAIHADENGRFRIGGLAAGGYRIAVDFDGFAQAARTVTIPDESARLALDFVLAPGELSVGVTVTATRSERDTQLVPLRTDTYSREQLQADSPVSTGDALVKAPGITPVGSGPFQVRPRLRGLDSTRLLVLVDGERLNNARTATDMAGIEVGLVDPSTVESLEVVGGSGSVLYGTDALAGTVNIITTQPQFTDTRRLTYGVDGLFSSNERGRRGALTLGLTDRRVALQVSASLEDFGNYRAGRNGDEDTQSLFAQGTLTRQDTIDDAFGFNFNAFPDPFNAPFVRTSNLISMSSAHGSNINASALFALGTAQTLQVKYVRRRMGDVGFPDFETPYFFQKMSLPYSNLDRASVRYEARSLTRWLTDLKLTAYYQEQARVLRTEFPVQFPVPSAGFFPINVYRLQITSDSTQRVRTPGFDAQATLVAGSRHVLTAGATVYADRSRDSRTTVSQMAAIGSVSLGMRGPQANVYADPQLVGGETTTHPVRVPEATFRDAGAFVLDEWQVASWLRVVTGLRLDRYAVVTRPTADYDVESLTAGAQPAIDPAMLPDISGDRLSRTALTGDIGIVIHPRETVSVHARYGRSYRHPNLEELLFSGPATVGSIVPNIKVGPETGNNIDVGVKLRSGRYAAALSYFNNTYHGFISTEIVAQTSAGALSQAVNFADVRIQGLESTVEAPIPLWRAVVTPFGAFTYTRGEVLHGSNPLTGTSLDGTPQDDISPFKMVAGVRVADAGERFWAEYGVRAHAKVSRVAPTLLESPYLIAQDLLSLGGFAIHRLAWGVNLGRQGRNRFGLTFAVENLTDRFYREQFQFAPARGRTFTLGIHLEGL